MSVIEPEKIAELKRVISEMAKEKEFLEIMDRGLVLMEAGLKERPLDRDLFLLIKMKHESKRKSLEDNYLMATAMLKVVEKMDLNEGRT